MNMVILIGAVVVLAVLLAVLFSLLRAEHIRKVKDTNRKIILSGGKNVNPDAVANGDGIIGENMGQDVTVIKGRAQRQRRKTQYTLCLTEMKSQRMYRGRFYRGQIQVGRAEDLRERQPEGKLYLEDSKISHVHCRIFVENNGYQVEDCHSTNHTWVNGTQVTVAVSLHNGDLLRLASKNYQVQFLLEQI